MKHITPPTIIFACTALAFVTALPSLAQVTVKETKETIETTPESPAIRETTTTTTGTISDFADERIVLRTETAKEPLTYSSTKTTTYVDEAGNRVAIEKVKSGLPVTVYYTKVGDEMIANKVIVRKTTTTTGRSDIEGTTVMGTVTELAPEALVVRTATSTSPLRYKFTKTTAYVDEAGKPVSIKTVTSGVPVTVHYDEVGGALVAKRVVVRRTTTAPGGVPETTTETKTTTSAGTINEFTPERIVVRSEEAREPLTYSYTKTTTYVDEAGAPVSLEMVKSGLPVTVYYTTHGDSRVATKVVVRKKTTTVTPR
jgi:hypothetical protein